MVSWYNSKPGYKLEGTVKQLLRVMGPIIFSLPAAPCSSPDGQSSQTPPRSRRPDPPAAAAALGRSSFGPPCRELITPPAPSNRHADGKNLRVWTNNGPKRCNERDGWRLEWRWNEKHRDEQRPSNKCSAFRAIISSHTPPRKPII